jgi:hypothetical protein
MAGYHMPPLATYVRDDAAVEALKQWIEGPLTTRATYSQWLKQHQIPAGAEEASRQSDIDLDGASNEAEYLLDTHPQDPSSVGALAVVCHDRLLAVRFFRKANRVYDLQSTRNLQAAESWSSVEAPANAYFVSGEDAWAQWAIPVESHAQFFRLKVTER